MSASSLGNVVIAIKAVDEASSVMGKIQTSVGLLGGALQNLGGGFAQVGTVMQGFAAGGPAGAAIAAAGEIAKGLQECIQEATASEAVFTSLGAAVTRSGTAWDTVTAATKKALLAMQSTTTYSDEQLAATLEQLLTFGLSYDDAMKALGETIDFAAAKHMDLTAAATLVGKAMDGNTAILKRYGVDLQTTKDQAGELKLAHDAAAGAIKALGKGVEDWVVSVTTAIGADTVFENGLDAAKDKAEYLIEQFKAGNIDLPQFTTAMQTLGVQLDEAKMKGGSAEEVLSKLNEQFGGAAQAQASTYAGIQERLKNATQEVGEKIGTIFLPALASLTEGMIPVANGLGKAVDGFSAFLTEIGKMPEAKGIFDSLGEAFSGWMQYCHDFWELASNEVGPVLKELMDAFKELWDALSPIGDALKELASAFGDTGNFDLFKSMLLVLVLNIRAVAEVIKEVSPYIKAFAQAFKDAADFITPILTQIVGAVRAFTDDLRTIFQGFYTWLVGGSLWTDLWDAVLAIAGGKMGQLLTDLGAKLFSPMQTAFTTTLQQLQASWTTGWQTIQTTFNTITGQVQADLNTRLDTMIADLRESTNRYAPTAAFALQGMQNALNAGMALIRGDWQGALTLMQNALESYWGAVQTATGTAFASLEGAFATGTSAIRDILSGAIGVMEGLWTAFIGFMSTGLGQLQGILGTASGTVTSTIATMQTSAGNAVAQIQSTLSNAWTSITQGAQSLWDALVGHSIWTDMLDEMQAQTASALGNIVGSFQNMSLTIPATVPYVLPTNSSPAAAAPTPRTTSSLGAPQSLTIPITVTLDGQVITKTVKKILIEDRQYRDRSVGSIS
jgi:phage-related protein